ncbi:MAG: NUDIX domain-containing protein [Candidatus Doudnabacteria bacterium]|nr:NUDIX domain-containing protein [Candidatus Doudnabacteria bacterium]
MFFNATYCILRIVYRLGYYGALVYWFLVRPQVRGVKVVIIARSEVLLIRNSYGPAGWTFPGGGIKSGETSEQAAIREVWEEVGIEISEPEYVGMFLHTKEFKADHVEVFAVHMDKQNPVVDNTEVVEARWFPISDLPLLTPAGAYTHKIIDYPL